MIRKFTLLCKLILIKKSDLVLFYEATNLLKPTNEICPCCGAKHSCSFHATYERDFIVMESTARHCHKVTIQRVICSSCGHTHALLPDVLIPYGSYSLFFILSVLRDYFQHSYTWESICNSYGISISTLASWIRLFHTQKALWLGALKNSTTSSLDFLNSLDLGSFLEPFFLKYTVSFLQVYHYTTPYHLP